jgi:hypothetical protein
MTCTIIPPYLLQRIVESAPNAGPAGRCLRTLELDDRLRAARQQPGREMRAASDAPADSDAKRTIYDANKTEELPGTPARSDNDPATGDVAVDEAFDSSGHSWDLFADVFQRQSMDGNGTPLTVTVHYGADYNNAFWDGRQLVFGDGDGEIFESFTKPMDVMVHEFTHGVTQHTAALTYQGQSGALNESVSDVFAAICKQRVNNRTAEQADWLIGAGLFKTDVQATALRSMKAPGTAYDDPRLGKDPQVGSMSDYLETEDDNGGVHINSGIPNRAFYLASTSLGGNSWDQAGPIWYQALTGGEVTAATDFIGFATATVNAAKQLYADDPGVATKVEQAWTDVGVLGARGGAGGEQPRTSPPRTFAVQRSGGFAGIRQATEVDLDGDPQGPQLSSLLERVDFSGLQAQASQPQPDRYVYDVSYGEQQARIGEQDLSAELSEAIKIAFSRR